MSAHPPRPPADQPPAVAVEVRVLDPGHHGDPDHAPALYWQVLDGHGRLLASGQVAGAPNTAELAGWRYEAFTDAAKAAIAALKDLEHAARPRVCDFCAAGPSAWRYPVQRQRPAAVLVADVLVVVPGGDWYACGACHLLVETGDWLALSQRAGLPAGQGAALWASFRARRAGPAVPLGPGHGPASHGQRGPDR